MSLTAPPAAVYPDIDTAFSAIQLYAKESGYAFFKLDKKPSRVVFACDRAGKYNPKGTDANTHTSKQSKATDSRRCDCLMKVELRLDPISST
jgi:hypothetical protein